MKTRDSSQDSLDNSSSFSRLKIIWRDKTARLLLKLSWYGRSSDPPSFMPVRAGPWQQKIERRIQVLEMRRYRWLLNISYKDNVTNEEVRNRIQNAIGVLTMVKKCKLRWNGHISRSSGTAKTVLRGQWKEQKGERDRRRDGKIKSRNGREWGLEISWGQQKTGKGGKALLQRHLWCPDDLRRLGIEMRDVRKLAIGQFGILTISKS